MVTKTPFPFLRLSCCPLQDMTAFYTHLGSFMPVFLTLKRPMFCYIKDYTHK